MKILGPFALAATVSWLWAVPAYPQTQDVKGSSDHPRISRFEGSVILNAGDFGRLVLDAVAPGFTASEVIALTEMDVVIAPNAMEGRGETCER